jgi:hypothetical protein
MTISPLDKKKEIRAFDKVLRLPRIVVGGDTIQDEETSADLP